VSRHKFVSAVIFFSERDRGKDSSLLDTIDELLHVFIHPDLKGMPGEVVDQF
jgi:hypothetical protein